MPRSRHTSPVANTTVLLPVEVDTKGNRPAVVLSIHGPREFGHYEDDNSGKLRDCHPAPIVMRIRIWNSVSQDAACKSPVWTAISLAVDRMWRACRAIPNGHPHVSACDLVRSLGLDPADQLDAAECNAPGYKPSTSLSNSAGLSDIAVDANAFMCAERGSDSRSSSTIAPRHCTVRLNPRTAYPTDPRC